MTPITLESILGQTVSIALICLVIGVPVLVAWLLYQRSRQRRREWYG